MVRSSAILKSLTNRKFTFLIYLKRITIISKLLFFFLSHTQIHKLHYKLMDTLFHCLIPFSGFSFQSNPHNKGRFLILRNTGFHNQFYIWIVTSLKSSTITNSKIKITNIWLAKEGTMGCHSFYFIFKNVLLFIY